MTDFTQSALRNHVARLPANERGQFYRDLSAKKHRVIIEAGKPIDFSDPGPKTCVTAPLVEIIKDQFGRTKRVTPVESIKPQVESRAKVDMERFRGQMKIAESFAPEDKAKAIKAIYLEHLGIEI